MEIRELKEYIENFEGKQLRNYYKLKPSKFDFAPINSQGDVTNSKDARPNVIFRIEKDMIVITHIYLNKTRQGLGTYIINWLIEYGRKNNKKQVSLRNVSTLEMNNLAKKLGFKKEVKNEFLYIIKS